MYIFSQSKSDISNKRSPLILILTQNLPLCINYGPRHLAAALTLRQVHNPDLGN